MGTIKRRNKTIKTLPVGEGTNVSITINGILVPVVRVTAAGIDQQGTGVLVQVEELYYE